MAIATGDVLGDYRVLAPLGAGAMGEVYRARDEKLGRDVALKLLPEATARQPERLARFEREARLLASLNHPNVATIHGFEKRTDVCFLVLELIDGRTLAHLLERGAPAVELGLDIAHQVALAVESAHQAGVIHRDLKPANIMITTDQRVKVLDFGLAVFRGTLPDDATTLVRDVTREGTILGTPAYMSPEQWRGEPIDLRSDVWAFGCLLYELFSGRRAFAADDSRQLGQSIQSGEPEWDALPSNLPSSVRDLVLECLQKDSALRLSDMTSARLRIEKLSGTARDVWAHQEALPEIHRLMDEDDFLEAQALLRDVEKVLGEQHPRVQDVWQESSGELEITTEPVGAKVSFQRYEDFAGSWKDLGETPLHDPRFPRGVFRFRIEMPGHATVEVPFNVALSSYVRALTTSQLRSANDPSTRLNFRLVRTDDLPAGMVAVEGGLYHPVPLAGLTYGDAANIPRFFVDRTEVTNQDFQEFVSAGGYEEHEWWPERLEIDGRELSFEQAREHLKDTTGRFGPAGWELGEYPEGTGDHPVSGVSWYEAIAYCNFRERQLPTVFHWARAAFPSWDNGAPLSPVMARFSNFSQQGTEPVGQYPALSVAGALDMVGNVAEWTLNDGGLGHFVLGGSFADPPYVVNTVMSAPPFTRRPTIGFRCALYDPGECAKLTRALDFPRHDFDSVPTMPDEAFEQTRRLHRYRRSPLAAQVESQCELPFGALEEWITIDAAYPGDRITVRIRRPLEGSAPFQTVVVAPSAQSFFATSLAEHLYEPWEEFLVKTGRALVEPVLAGTFERQDGRLVDDFNTSLAGRDQYLLRWVQDFGRTIDYLEERSDLDASRIAFLGTSFGAWISPHVLAYEPRYRAAVLWAGGFAPFEAEGHLHLRVNLARRVTIPILLLNGRYDYQMPLDHQQAMIRLYGAPDEHKRHVVFEASHWPYPRGELIKETLSWLDRYLGPVSES